MSVSRRLLLLFILLRARSVFADGGDDFANNLFSDLGPLLALFGERVTMQFMSGAMGWADNIILAMAPLGIITAIEVCELWNGQEIVRCIGSPSVVEFICLLPVDTQAGNKTFNIEVDDKVEKLNDKDRHLVKIDLNIKDDVRRWRDSQKPPQPTCQKDSEGNPAPQTIIIERNSSRDAPNISLNTHRETGRGELRVVAFFGTILQLGVLLYSGFATYYPTLKFQKDGSSIASYAYPCAATGTLVLVVGMMVCAHVVESSTEEERFHPREQNMRVRMVWLQQNKTVSDQVFGSFAIYAKNDQPFITTSRRPRHKSVGQSRSTSQEGKQWASNGSTALEVETVLGTMTTMTGFILQFVGLRGLHWSASIAQLGAVFLMVCLKAWVRRGLATPPEAESLPSGYELDWFAKTLGKADQAPWNDNAKYGPSFGASSSAEDASESLGANGCVGEWKIASSGGVYFGREKQLASSDSPSGKQDRTPDKTLCQGDAETTGSCIPGSSALSAEEVLNIRKNLGHLSEWRGPASAEAVCLARAIEIAMDTLVGLSPMTSTSKKSTSKASATIDPASGEMFFWSLEANYGGSDCHSVNFQLYRQANGKWKAYANEYEAALSLWLSSIKDEKKVKDEKDINDEKKTAAGLPRYNGVTENPINKRDDVRLRMEESKGKQSLRLLGFHTQALHQDLQWWLPKDLYRIFELRQLQARPDGVSDAESILEMEAHRTIGYGRQKWIQTYVPGTSGEAESPQNLSLFSRKSLLDETEDHGEHVCESGTILAAESYASLPLLFAQHIFSAFMHAVASWDGPKELFQSVADVQPNTSGSSINWKSFTLQNATLSTMIREIESTGLGSLEDIYLSVLPPLSQNQKLPRADDAIIKLAREQARQHELLQHWQEATRIYLWLLQTANIFGGQEIVTKATAVVVEYLRQVSSTVDLRKAKDWLLERRVLEQATEDVAKELNKYDNRDIMLSLMILYEERGYLEKRPEACEQKTKDRSCRDVALSDTSPEGNNRHPTAFSFINLQKTSARHREAADEVETSNRGRLDAKDIHHWTPLHELGRTGHRYGIGMNTFEEGTQESGGISPRDLLDWTPLHHACSFIDGMEGSIEGGERESIIYQLIHEGADINAQGRDGMTPLHCASIEGNSRAVAILIEAGANVDIQDASGTTPLLWAAYKGWEDIAKNLWEVANKRRRDIEGRTVLHLAALSGQTPIVRWLVVDQGVEKEAQDSRMRRPLHWAVQNGHEEVAALLIEQKADKEAQDSYGFGSSRPLHYAAVRGYEQLIALLVDEGAEIEARGEQGLTPLHFAAAEGYVKAAEMLLKKGANIEAKLGLTTALLLAAKKGQAAVVALLIHQGAERDVVDKIGETPLHKAATSGSTETVMTLSQAD
ncbi:Ankyrin repeat, PH and SEC7 domain containing protein secG [Colletotrichum fructicola Nara gc5]|uniref:Ankyrin repeat, PH and SEC7 domain containing protein secG n=1 Tax=Colletotrichum fructicola (strain Nara gc5) TaxID=1213859 RepID=A0A7J6JC63_COLFN|nr:Ankyrin repeat, PH and SEC7 domain containing protein secG [Colletotrichum fructicola Nara gc5]